MTLMLTQPLTEMSTKNISWEVKAAGVYGRPYHPRVPTVMKSESINLLEPQGLPRPVTVIALHLRSHSVGMKLAAKQRLGTDNPIIGAVSEI